MHCRGQFRTWPVYPVQPRGCPVSPQTRVLLRRPHTGAPSAHSELHRLSLAHPRLPRSPRPPTLHRVFPGPGRFHSPCGLLSNGPICPPGSAAPAEGGHLQVPHAGPGLPQAAVLLHPPDAFPALLRVQQGATVLRTQQKGNLFRGGVGGWLRHLVRDRPPVRWQDVTSLWHCGSSAAFILSASRCTSDTCCGVFLLPNLGHFSDLMRNRAVVAESPRSILMRGRQPSMKQHQRSNPEDCH